MVKALRRLPTSLLVGTLIAAAVALAAVSGCSKETMTTIPGETYDQVTLALHPVLFLAMDPPSTGREDDLTGHGHDGVYLPAGALPKTAPMPNGDLAADFNGQDQYLQVPDSPDLSVPETRILTLECWIRPNNLQPRREEGSGYVNFIGKSEHGRNDAEYEMRMYSKVNSEVPMRPNRLSVYVFNLPGGEGSGAYVQDPMTVGQWIMLVEVINTTPSNHYPLGYVTIYKNGVQRETVGLTQHDTVPQHGAAPFRVGSCDPRYSFFPGAIGKVALFNCQLSPQQVLAQYRAMVG
jgi:hypothetical protein